MKPTKRTVAIFLAVLLLGGGVFGFFNWYNRYVWPSPVSWMQDLPAEDRSQWPRVPVLWSNVTVEVNTANPEGMRKTNIAYFINSVGVKLVRIEPGTFRMGLSEEEIRRFRYGNQLGHQVTLTKPYYLGAFEILNREYEQYDPHHRSKRPSYQRGKDGDQHPVEGVTWRDAQLFCRWLSQKEGRQYRLPTEAEWEYACKAGTETRTYWGDNVWDRNKANAGGLNAEGETWLEDGNLHSAPVGSYPPNPWGLYDMIGNAREWNADWYLPYTTNAAVDPVGPTNVGRFRVMKGVGWSTRTRHITSSNRDGNNPADLHDVIGLRVMCEAGTN